jgi:predicted kinase
MNTTTYKPISLTPTPVLYLLIGGIASGKTTVRRILETGLWAERRMPEYVSICPDDIRKEISGDAGDQSVNKAAWGRAYSRMEAAMQQGQTVIFDAAYMVKSRTRKSMQAYAKKYGYRVVYIILDTPVADAHGLNQARERQVPTDVIDRYHADFMREFPFIQEDKKSDGEI